MHSLKIMGRGGHDEVTWDLEQPETVTEAAAEFERLVQAGYAAFNTSEGTRDSKITVFEPEAERIVLVPPLSGG